jgi:hypothetical protein
MEPMPANWTIRTAGLGFLALTACTGALDSPGHGSELPGGRADSPGSDSGPGGSTAEAGNGAGFTPLRRLTQREYNNTLRDLLGDTTRPGDSFLPADTRGTSRFTVGGVVSNVEARAFYEASKTIAAAAIARKDSFFTCDVAALGESSCADHFIRDFGKRAYRRPLTAEEITGLRGVYDWAKTQDGYSHDDGLRVTLQAMLQSPAFIYHQETSARPVAGDALVRLTPYEVASRLSYFLWASMPDDALFAAADAGRLGNPEELAAEAGRLLADARSSEALESFHHDWLLLDQLAIAEKDNARFPDFTPEARAAMQAETTAFVRDVFRNDGTLPTLLTANYTFADASLSRIYDVPAPAGSGLVRIELNPAQGRSGLLTQLAVLANAATPYSTSPVRRGKFVREQLLCQDLPPPAPNVDTNPPVPMPNVPARQQWQQHSDDPACSGCHALMDPIGFAFEHFDAIGRFRATDGGVPVDASGQITGSESSDGSFTGARQLAQHLIGSDQVHRCVATQWFRYALGRLESEADARSLAQAYQAFKTGNLDLRELLVALTLTNGFVFRRVAEGETP